MSRSSRGCGFLVGLGFRWGFAVLSGFCWGCLERGFEDLFMGPDLRKSESSKPPEESPGRNPREEANVATSDLIASMSSPSPPRAEGFFAFLVRFDLEVGSAMDSGGGRAAAIGRRDEIGKPR